MRPGMTTGRGLGLGLALVGLGALLRCGGQGGVQAPAPEAEVLVRIVWASGESRVIPPDVQAFYIEVTAPDISPPITRQVLANEVVGGQAETLLYIPPGANRLISVEARDAGGRVLAEGSATVQIFAAQTTQVNIVLGETLRAQLLIHPSDLFFEWDEDEQTFYIGNTGTATLTWSLTIPPSAPWLTGLPATGSLAPAAEQAVAVSVNRTGLAEGDYTADISITSDGGDGSVRVDMTVFIQRIAFTSGDAPTLTGTGLSRGEIFVMNADGTNPVQLTNTGVVACGPAWSPDRTKIAYHICDQSVSPLNVDIWVMNADGSNPVKLTDSPGVDYTPMWSPDGSKIAFSSDRDGNREIYLMNSDGTNQVNLTNNPAFDWQPTWSPGGGEIAFGTNRRTGGGAASPMELFIMNADGSDPHAVPYETGHACHISWSPGGTTLVYNHCTNATAGQWEADIFAVGINGNSPRRLTNLPGREYIPRWFPGGGKIAFAAEKAVGGTNLNCGIFVMDSDGSNAVEITSNTKSNLWPSWRPPPTRRRARVREDEWGRAAAAGPIEARARGAKSVKGSEAGGDVCGKGPCMMMGKGPN